MRCTRGEELWARLRAHSQVPQVPQALQVSQELPRESAPALRSKRRREALAPVGAEARDKDIFHGFKKSSRSYDQYVYFFFLLLNCSLMYLVDDEPCGSCFMRLPGAPNIDFMSLNKKPKRISKPVLGCFCDVVFPY